MELFNILPSEKAGFVQKIEKANNNVSAVKNEYVLPATIKNGIATVLINGTLCNWLSSTQDVLYGIIGYENIENAINALVKNESVKGIILNINSYGGHANGCPELASYIKEMQSIKPIMAFTSSVCCSAAYMLASNCTAITATRSATLGSIGTIISYVDESGMLEKMGAKVVAVTSNGAGIKARNYKDDNYMQHLQEITNECTSMFIASIANGRNITTEKAKSYANGKTYFAKQALELGLIDEIKNFKTLRSNFASLLAENKQQNNNIKNKNEEKQMTTDNEKLAVNTSAGENPVVNARGGIPKQVENMPLKNETAETALQAVLTALSKQVEINQSTGAKVEEQAQQIKKMEAKVQDFETNQALSSATKQTSNDEVNSFQNELGNLLNSNTK